jgi:hypothetical protein
METYCMMVKADVKSAVRMGAAVVTPTRASCRKVLYLLIVVGRTSAEGSEKSQYRANVFGGGREIQR